MKPGVRYCLSSALLAFTLTPLAAFAQTQPTPPATITTTTIVTQTGMPAAVTPPEVTNANEVLALQSMLDVGLTAEDIQRVLPLLEDLRDHERMLRVSRPDVRPMLVGTSNRDVPVMGPQLIQQEQQQFMNHEQSVWNTITQYIGANKADVLHRLVNPPTIASNYWANAYSRFQTNQTNLLAMWDQQEATRRAGLTPGTETTTTVTTTTVTTEPVPAATDMSDIATGPTNAGFAMGGAAAPTLAAATITDGPYLSYSDLVNLLQRKFVAMESTGQMRIWPDSWRDRLLTAPGVRDINDYYLGTWK